MIQSHPIVVEGRVLGAVVSHQSGWHFIAADPAVVDLHGQLFQSLAEATRVAGLVLARAQAVPATLPVLRAPPSLRVVE
jgi:hypothetical protein